MKKILFALLFIFGALSVSAQSGLTCDDPIPVDSNYVGTISAPGEYWFTAWTYDLPLNVHFTPVVDNSSTSPTVEVDFTCTPGVYDDEKLHNVINNVSSFGLDLPVEFRCAKVERYGKIEWDLSINSNYREELTKCGITYNVQAFVKVNFSEAGEISFKPDTAYISCMQNATYVNLGDTLDVAANDAETYYAFPYSEWCKDSIQFAWTGDKSARIWVSDGDCDFTPSNFNVDIRAQYDVTNTTPYKLRPADMDAAISDWLGGGVFFAKVVSSSPGKLIVEKIPMGPIQGGAILLQHDVPVQLAANDQRVFCFPRTWTSTQFAATTPFLMSMYAAPVADFIPSADDSNVLNYYAFSLVNNTRVQQLSSTDIKTLVESVVDDYVYVRFVCNQSTTLTPTIWTPTSCADKSLLIQPDHKLTIDAKPNNTIFRLKYDEWKDYDMKLTWTGNSTLPTYFADACEFTLSSSNSHVLTYKNIKARGSSTIKPNDMLAWASSVDENGFVYVRFNPTNKGRVTFTTTKPAEEDPVIPTDPCVINSIELKLGDKITLNLDSAFTVYSIKYADWLANGASLTWSGVEVLHTFVAETCEFYVAPYNKYVHVYVPVQGEHTLDAAAMADLAEYVDENGYLYVRFLTEKEGVLTVE